MICNCIGHLNSMMPLTVDHLMLPMIIVKKLADCDVIAAKNLEI